jgi:hypothetical protein
MFICMDAAEVGLGKLRRGYCLGSTPAETKYKDSTQRPPQGEPKPIRCFDTLLFSARRSRVAYGDPRSSILHVFNGETPRR